MPLCYAPTVQQPIAELVVQRQRLMQMQFQHHLSMTQIGQYPGPRQDLHVDPAGPDIL